MCDRAPVGSRQQWGGMWEPACPHALRKAGVQGMPPEISHALSALLGVMGAATAPGRARSACRSLSFHVAICCRVASLSLSS